MKRSPLKLIKSILIPKYLDRFLKESIAAKLMTMVFSIYIIITISVTVVHMSAEYYYAKDTIIEDLKTIRETFSPGIAIFLYEMDYDGIKELVSGMIKLPVIKGIVIHDEQGEQVVASGTVGTKDGKFYNIDADGNKERLIKEQLFSTVFWEKFQVTDSEDGILLGRLVLYSNTNIILRKVRVGFIFIVLNSIIKTLALWIIFLVIARILLSRPLAAFTRATEQLDFDNLENKAIDIETEDQNELKKLENAFNSMISKLGVGKKRMTSLRSFSNRIGEFTSTGEMTVFAFQEMCSNTLLTSACLFQLSNESHHSKIESFNGSGNRFKDSIASELMPEKLPKDSGEIIVGNRLQADHWMIQLFFDQKTPTTGHLLLVKLVLKEEYLFCLYRNKSVDSFDTTDQEYIRCMINEVETAQKNINTIKKTARIETELETARAIQFSYLPEKLPEISGYDLDASFSPAREVSGDYFDFLSVNGQSTAFVIADVSGKGIPAAMLSNITRVLLRDKIHIYEEPKELLCALNDSIKSEFLPNQFLTLSLFLLEHEQAKVTYFSAGHEPMVLVKSSQKTAVLLKPKGYPFSQLHADRFQDRITNGECTLDSGDLLFCYTDGLTDVTNGEQQFGEERLYATIEQLHSEPAGQIIKRLTDQLKQFQGTSEQADDMTMIALKRL